eukprot:930761-Prymnesium_polylepis.1
MCAVAVRRWVRVQGTGTGTGWGRGGWGGWGGREVEWACLEDGECLAVALEHALKVKLGPRVLGTLDEACARRDTVAPQST